MKSDRLRRNKSFKDFIFFFGSVFLTISFFISYLTMKNDSIFLRNEIYHMDNIRTNHTNRVSVLSGKVKNLSRQDRIEQVAYDKFNFHVPAPESLIVYVGD